MYSGIRDIEIGDQKLNEAIELLKQAMITCQAQSEGFEKSCAIQQELSLTPKMARKPPSQPILTIASSADVKVFRVAG